MMPPAVKKEEDVAKAIEVWEEEIRELEHVEGPGEGLPDDYKVTALKRLLTGRIKEHIEFKEAEPVTFARIREEVMRWANQRRIEHVQDSGDPMDIGHIADGRDERNEWEWDQEESWGQTPEWQEGWESEGWRAGWR